MLMAEIDIKQVYRNILIHQDDRNLLGLKWQGQPFTLPFGIRSALKIFTALADTLQWIVQSWGMDLLVHYIDDILTVGSPGSSQCQDNLSCLK